MYVCMYVYTHIYENHCIKFSRLNSDSDEWIVQNNAYICIYIYFFCSSRCCYKVYLYIGYFNIYEATNIVFCTIDITQTMWNETS